MLLVQTTLQEGAGIGPGGGMTLDIHMVARSTTGLAPEEVVETHLVLGGGRGEGRKMPTDTLRGLVGLHNHHRRIPTNETANPFLQVLVAGEPRLFLSRNRVHVRSGHAGRVTDLQLSGSFQNGPHEKSGPAPPVLVDNRLERVQPLLGLLGVNIRELMEKPVNHRGVGPPWMFLGANSIGSDRRSYTRCVFAVPTAILTSSPVPGNLSQMSIWSLDPTVSHLNHGSFGATPTRALEAQQRWRRRLESNPTRFMLEHYQPALDRARERVAEFVGAEPAGLVFVNNATAGVNAVLRSLEPTLRAGDEIVITDHGYNACRNAVTVTAARSGARVVVASVPFPVEGPQEVIDSVMGVVTDRTRLLLIDSITSPTALVLPVRELVAALEPDIEVLVDAAHAPGMVDFDVSAIRASYITANCHKWMCAPKGSAFLYVREDRRPKIYPAVISHGYNGAWPADGGHLHTQFDWTGTDDPTAWLAVPESLETVGSLQPDGWEGVRRANRELCLAGRDMLIDMIGTEPPAPDRMIGSMAAISLPDSAATAGHIFDPLMIALRSRWSIEVMVFAWPQPPGRLLRISAQQYNGIDEFERLGNAVASELSL